MYSTYLVAFCFLLSAVCQVQSDCNTYVNCFGDIINDFFSDALINTTILHSKGDLKSMIKKPGEDQSDEIDVGKVFIEVVKALKEIIANDSTLNADSKYEALKHINDKTSIYINAFNLNEFPASEDDEKETYKTTKLLPVIIKPTQSDESSHIISFALPKKDYKVPPNNNQQANSQNENYTTIGNDVTTEYSFEEAFTDTLELYETLNNTFKMIEYLNDTINDISKDPSINLTFATLPKTNKITKIDSENSTPLGVIALSTQSTEIVTTTAIPGAEEYVNITTNVTQDAMSSYSSNEDVTTNNYDMLTIIFEENLSDENKFLFNKNQQETKTTKNITKSNEKLKVKAKFGKHNLSIDLQTYFKSKVNEIGSAKDDSSVDFLDEEPDYLLIDYLDIFKDTSADANIYPTTEVSDYTEYTTVVNCNDSACDNATEVQNNLKYNPPPLTPVYPWIVAIYIKSDNSDQFEYYCDGALLSDRCILTAARCVWRGNQTVETKHVIAILGKQNLKAMRFEERIIRIHQITVHPNFTTRGEESTNDLAMMHMEHAVIFSDRISAARMETDEDNGDIDKAATTGWAYNGELTPIYFDQQISDYCKTKTSRTRFCATYAPEVTVCPSRGGLFVIKLSSRWYLHGISTGGRSQTAACFGNDAEYTSLTTYMTWILDTLNLKYI